MKRSSEILQILIEKENINPNQLAAKMGLKRTQPIYDILNGKIKKLSENYAVKINQAYPDYNLKWLLTGQGDMTTADEKDTAGFILPQNIFLAPLVGQYAYAGYLNGFSDPEYIGALPLVPIMADHELRGTYVAFEVKGDSMDNESSDSLLEGDILICRRVNQDLWKDKLHIRKWDFVIVHNTDGVLVKRIIEHDTLTCEIKIHSLNELYADKTISLNDVAQLFNVIQVIRNRRR